MANSSAHIVFVGPVFQNSRVRGDYKSLDLAALNFFFYTLLLFALN
jgi:hypothetical protein